MKGMFTVNDREQWQFSLLNARNLVMHFLQKNRLLEHSVVCEDITREMINGLQLDTRINGGSAREREGCDTAMAT